MKTYNVGDTVWWVRYKVRRIEKPCPVCFGKLEVMLILGNGDEVALLCNYCGHGVGKPSGSVSGHKYSAEPEAVTITKITTESSADGETRTYYTFGHHFSNSEIFETKEEAAATCNELIRKREHDRAVRAELIKADVHKSFSWNAGYHLKNADKHRDLMKYHEKNACLCKDRIGNTRKGRMQI